MGTTTMLTDKGRFWSDARMSSSEIVSPLSWVGGRGARRGMRKNVRQTSVVKNRE